MQEGLLPLLKKRHGGIAVYKDKNMADSSGASSPPTVFKAPIPTVVHKSWKHDPCLIVKAAWDSERYGLIQVMSNGLLGWWGVAPMSLSELEQYMKKHDLQPSINKVVLKQNLHSVSSDAIRFGCAYAQKTKPGIPYIVPMRNGYNSETIGYLGLALSSGTPHPFSWYSGRPSQDELERNLKNMYVQLECGWRIE